MLTKAITYTNYNGEKRTKNFYFNLTRTELSKMELLEKAGMEGKIRQMIDTDDREEIVRLIDEMILGSVGEKSPDGEEFIKNDEIRERFKSHPAYDVLFMELLNAEPMAAFINAVMPQDLVEEAKKNPQKSINDIMGYEVVPEEELQKANLTAVK